MMGLVAFGGSAQHNVNGSGDSVYGACAFWFFLNNKNRFQFVSVLFMLSFWVLWILKAFCLYFVPFSDSLWKV
jgi:hypothetical protein